jgi:hypothetical protein
MDYNVLELVLSYVNDYYGLVRLTCVNVSWYKIIKESNIIWEDVYVILEGHIVDENLKYPIKMLDCCENVNVTDLGIKDMLLKVLDCGDNENITDLGIENMLLDELYCAYNENITDLGIKKMLLKVLNCGHNENITDFGIKNMSLKV